MQKQLPNNNLFVAKRLLQMVRDKGTTSWYRGGMYVDENMIPELSPREIEESVRALQRRNTIEYSDETVHTFGDLNPLVFRIWSDEGRLRRFVRVARNIINGVDFEDRSQVKQILAGLHVLRSSKLDKQNER